MFKKILIANRGEIAIRIIRAAKSMGIDTVAIYSTADKDALHVQLATQAVCVGGPLPKESYLNIENILSAAILTDAEAIHPGYGYLAENTKFVRLAEQNNLTFIGPDPEIIDMMSNKSKGRDIMKRHGVPVVPGTGIIEDVKDGLARVIKMGGFPVLIKASAGGGGKGIRAVYHKDSFATEFDTVTKEAQSAFGDGSVYLERLITNPKHIEFQFIADKHGNYVHLYERDCSIQYNHKKIIEEAPCRTLKDEVRQKMAHNVINAAKAMDYVNAGTFEFIMDKEQNYYFIEMNTRIQVEHPITEMITGIDIIKEQIRVSAGHPLSIKQENVKPEGYSIECRINAEDPKANFTPSTGKIENFVVPGGFGVRVDTELHNGFVVSPFYDPLVGKLIVHGKSRLECIRKMRAALEELTIKGINTNIGLHYSIFHHPKYVEGNFDTGFLTEVRGQPEGR
ncbi:MAG: acetyl-CoA carboxylase biotin carboxylase subunit [Defluviitaleaceae bacterium]|nr:acetyl-CoA carboxylase biotin carboxylase subunit [Defluviitaleaceae bacterium]